MNVEKFKTYLDGLRNANEGEKICLFMDNLSAHTSDRSKDAMRGHGFKWIYNVPYSPDYNPIEFVFSIVKRNFRALRAQKLTGLIQDSHEAMVTKAVKMVKKKDVMACVNHV